jgi:hypothetical protein
MVDYKKNTDLDDEMVDSSPLKLPSKRRSDESASDLDFAAAGDSDVDDDSDGIGEVDLRELENQRERSRGSIATPPKGKSKPVKKPVASQAKGSAKRKSVPTMTSPVKIQQAAVKKSSAPRAPNKSVQAGPTSSNKTVGSKKSGNIKAKKFPQNSVNIGSTNPAGSSKHKDSTSNGDPNGTVGKDANKTQPKQEGAALKQSVTSVSPAKDQANLGSSKAKSLALKPANATGTIASIGHKKPVASKSAQVPQAATMITTPSTSSARSKLLSISLPSSQPNSAITSPYNSAPHQANSKQTTDNTPRATARHSPADSKNVVFPLSTRAAPRTIPLPGPESMGMSWDNLAEKEKSQVTKMDLENGLATKMDTNNALRQIQPQTAPSMS